VCTRLIVVARRAGADVEAHPAVEFAVPELAGAAGDGAKLRVALEACFRVDLLVLSGHVGPAQRDEVLDDVDRGEGIAAPVQQDHEAMDLEPFASASIRCGVHETLLPAAILRKPRACVLA